MRGIFGRGRLWVIAAALVAFSVPLVSPTPAAAWWYHRGWGGHPGWGWHPGWGFGWGRGCCWGPRAFIGVPPPVFYAPPPVVFAPPPVVFGPAWVPGYWNRPYWGPGPWPR